MHQLNKLIIIVVLYISWLSPSVNAGSSSKSIYLNNVDESCEEVGNPNAVLVLILDEVAVEKADGIKKILKTSFPRDFTEEEITTMSQSDQDIYELSSRPAWASCTSSSAMGRKVDMGLLPKSNFLRCLKGQGMAFALDILTLGEYDVEAKFKLITIFDDEVQKIELAAVENSEELRARIPTSAKKLPTTRTLQLSLPVSSARAFI
jgi:hypothetical protein